MKKIKYLDKVKICGVDVYGKKFTINTNVKNANCYNTINANYWQRCIIDGKEKWKLMFQR